MTDITFLKTSDVPYNWDNLSIELNWNELIWGYENDLVTDQSAINFAVGKMMQGFDNIHIVELAGLFPNEHYDVHRLLEKINEEYEVKQTEDSLKHVWAFVCAEWLFANRAEYDSPLKKLAEIYSIFDSPVAMRNLIYYLPPVGKYNPAKHSLEQNNLNLMSAWEQYLRQDAKQLRKKEVQDNVETHSGLPRVSRLPPRSSPHLVRGPTLFDTHAVTN